MKYTPEDKLETMSVQALGDFSMLYMRVCIAVNIIICALLRQHIMMLWEESEEKQGKTGSCLTTPMMTN